MPSNKKSPSLQTQLSPDEQLDFIKIVYRDICESSRYYDSHIWQIPSVTIAVNAFLVGQAFSDSLTGATVVRSLVVFSTSFFTLVLLVALIKHRLHKNAQDENIQKIEKYMNLPSELHYRYNLSTPGELEKIEANPNIFERLLARTRAHTWLMSVMGVTLVADLVILIGIILQMW